jgi:hypothetical protein
MSFRLVLALLLLAQLADAASFVIGIPMVGIHAEANGMARLAFDAGGTSGVVLLKGAGILATLAILVYSAPRFPRMALLGASAALAFGVLGALLNTVSIAIAHG